MNGKSIYEAWWGSFKPTVHPLLHRTRADVIIYDDIQNREPIMTKKAAKKLVRKYRKAYPKVAEVATESFTDLTKFPRTTIQWVKQKDCVYDSAFQAGKRQGRSEEAQNLEKQYERATQQARIAGLTALTDLAKANSKMAYMLMMALNGGKPFGG